MHTENLSTLKIHKLSKEQYEREVNNGTIDEYALYFTPDEEVDFTSYATVEELNTKADASHNHDSSYDAKGSADTALASAKAYTNEQVDDMMLKNNPTGTGSFSMNRLSGTTIGNYSTAIGYNSTASTYYSHAEGCQTTASGESSHAEGYNTTASGAASHAAGWGTIANDYQYVVGKYNKNTTAPTSIIDTSASAGIFIVGIGSTDSSSDRKNGFRVNPAGKAYAQSSMSSGTGVDYAEYFEWIDGNPNAEDRRGRFVTLEGEKIRYATAEDDYVLGIISAEPCVIGGGQTEMWHNQYLTDIFGAKIEEVVEVEETTDENGKIIPAHTERRWVLNPDFDPEREYVSREERVEWDAVGIMGQLVLVDDGTCKVNGYCYPNIYGIAAASESQTNYRVMSRLDDTHIKVFIK